MSTDIIYPPVSMTQLPNNINLMSSNSDLSNINLIINDDITNNIINNIIDNENIMNNEIKNVIKYSIDDFYAVKNMIREDLGNITFFSLEIQDLLDQMFQSVPIISRKKKDYSR